ncbi:hypothetical protein C8R47DRAFT_1156119 [Mycena vitilis]|nr:hypothetical protein C8R47DRAFT_1156119 [Mycena vitilis]
MLLRSIEGKASEKYVWMAGKIFYRLDTSSFRGGRSQDKLLVRPEDEVAEYFDKSSNEFSLFSPNLHSDGTALIFKSASRGDCAGNCPRGKKGYYCGQTTTVLSLPIQVLDGGSRRWRRSDPTGFRTEKGVCLMSRCRNNICYGYDRENHLNRAFWRAHSHAKISLLADPLRDSQGPYTIIRLSAEFKKQPVGRRFGIKRWPNVAFDNMASRTPPHGQDQEACAGLA